MSDGPTDKLKRATHLAFELAPKIVADVFRQLRRAGYDTDGAIVVASALIASHMFANHVADPEPALRAVRTIVRTYQSVTGLGTPSKEP